MLELPHTIVGATLATKLGNPLLSLPLAFLSNFLLDLLPHWNPHLYTEKNHQGKISKKTILICLVDSSLALLVGLFLAFRFWPDLSRVIVVVFGCFLAVLADVLEVPYFFFGWENKYLLKLISLERKLQWNVSVLPGLFTQLVVLGVSLFLLFS